MILQGQVRELHDEGIRQEQDPARAPTPHPDIQTSGLR